MKVYNIEEVEKWLDERSFFASKSLNHEKYKLIQVIQFLVRYARDELVHWPYECVNCQSGEMELTVNTETRGIVSCTKCGSVGGKIKWKPLLSNITEHPDQERPRTPAS